MTDAVVIGRQLCVNQMVEQKAVGGFRRIRRQVPRPGAVSDGVPGPDRIGIHTLHQLRRRPDAAVAADHPHLLAVLDVQRLRRLAVDVKRVAAVDLAQPGVMRPPALVHRHRPLGHRVQRIFAAVRGLVLQRRPPHRQRIETVLDTPAQRIGRLHRAEPLRGETEFLQRLGVNLQDDLLRLADKSHGGGVFEIFPVGMAEIALVVGQAVLPESLVLHVTLELRRIGPPGAMRLAAGAAPARQQADAGRALVIGDEIGIAALVSRPALVIDQAGQAEAHTEIKQDILERAHVAVRGEHRLADGVGGTVGVADRPVEQRDAVPALQPGGVGQHQIGIGDGLGKERVGADDVRNTVFAGFRIGGGQHLRRPLRVHGGIPRQVGHVKEQRVDGVGITVDRVSDHRLHHALGGQRRFPRERLVDAAGRAVGSNQQILGAGGETQHRPRQRLVCGNLSVGPDGGWRRFRKRRAVAESARRVDAAEQHLQQVDGAAGVEAVGVGGDAAHGVDGDRASGHGLVLPPGPVGPRHRQGHLALEGGLGQFRCDAPDGAGRNAGDGFRRFRRIGRIEIALGHELKRGHRPAPVVQRHLAHQLRRNPRQQGVRHLAGIAVPAQRLAFRPAREQTVFSAVGIADHQPRQVGVADDEIEVDAVGAQQLMHDGENEQAVAAGPDGDPFVGDGGIAGAHRVDRGELDAAAFQGG